MTDDAEVRPGKVQGDDAGAVARMGEKGQGSRPPQAWPPSEREPQAREKLEDQFVREVL
jgi:hypothetical protein